MASHCTPVGPLSFGKDKALLRKAVEMVSNRRFTVTQTGSTRKDTVRMTIPIGYALPSTPLIVAPNWGTRCSIAFHSFFLACSFVEPTFVAFALLSLGLALGFSFPFWRRAFTN